MVVMRGLLESAIADHTELDEVILRRATLPTPSASLRRTSPF
jgi:hypothetical protein